MSVFNCISYLSFCMCVYEFICVYVHACVHMCMCVCAYVYVHLFPVSLNTSLSLWNRFFLPLLPRSLIFLFLSEPPPISRTMGTQSHMIQRVGHQPPNCPRTELNELLT